MLRYIGGRLIGAVILLLMTSFVVFSFEHLAPGSPESVLLGGRPATPALLASIRHEFHLDQPFLVQYGHWLVGVLHGDFGQSIAYKSAVASVVSGRVVTTLELGLYAGVIVLLVGVAVGVVAALKQDTVIDAAASVVTLVLSSVSSYVSGILLLAIFAVHLAWFPVIGTGSGATDRVYHLTLPAIALALALIALIARTTRASMARTLGQEFVETVRARGFTERRVVLKHALRSAFLPVLTISGLAVGYLISGAVLVEYTFGLNGLGSLLVKAVQAKDFAIVQAVTLIFTAVFIVLNLVVDVLYSAVDPRVRIREEGA
jgi:peptide/nickel transport system permease protein